jgi:SEC-C motif domain protein
MRCPCGREDSFQACCGLIIEGHSSAETAEALMRARYAAYATQHVDYIVASHHPDTLGDVDRHAIAKLSREARWLGLEILSVEGGAPGEDEGIVEFVARYEIQGRPMAHRERSLFRRHHGRWYFHSGQRPKQPTSRRTQPKIGRNDPCPCGSGKKYKKCCGIVG